MILFGMENKNFYYYLNTKNNLSPFITLIYKCSSFFDLSYMRHCITLQIFDYVDIIISTFAKKYQPILYPCPYSWNLYVEESQFIK